MVLVMKENMGWDYVFWCEMMVWSTTRTPKKKNLYIVHLSYVKINIKTIIIEVASEYPGIWSHLQAFW